MEKLVDMVKKAQNGDEKYMLEIIEKFKPLIKKYSIKLHYDGSDTDIVICLIETIRKMPIYNNINLNKEECIVGYINTSIKNKYISLSKKYMIVNNQEIAVDIQFFSTYKSQYNKELIDNHIFITFLLNKLSEYQRQIIQNIFIDNVSEVELAKRLHISRQCINKAKNRALSNLRKFATE